MTILHRAAAQSAGRYSVEEILSRCSDAGIRGIDIEYSQLADVILTASARRFAIIIWRWRRFTRCLISETTIL